MEKSSIITPETTDIVWDADNTLWDWVVYAVHAYEAMSQCISDETGIPEPQVAAAMKRFYSDVGTMENPYLIQGLYSMGFFKGVKDFDMDYLIDKAQSTFSEVRKQYLTLYEYIRKIIEELHKRGLRQHILTDAPGIQAPMRIQHFKLGEYFDSVNIVRPADPKSLPKKYREKQRVGEYKVPFKVRIVDKPKPHPNLEQVTRLTRKKIGTRVINIGDNVPKDGGESLHYDNRCIIAGYGIAKEDYLIRLLRFAPAKTAKQNVSLEKAPDINALPPNMIMANSTRELAELLGISL